MILTIVCNCIVLSIADHLTAKLFDGRESELICLWEKLGKGQSGNVYAGEFPEGQKVAIKFLTSNAISARMGLSRELSVYHNVIAKVQSNLFLKLFGLVPLSSKYGIGLISEQFADSRRLEDVSSPRGKVRSNFRCIVEQVLEGLLLLWSKGFIHNDLHAGNILIGKTPVIIPSCSNNILSSFSVKIIDFDRSWRARNVADLYFGILIDLDHFCFALRRANPSDDFNDLFISSLDDLEISKLKMSDSSLGKCRLCETFNRIFIDDDLPMSCSRGVREIASKFYKIYCEDAVLDRCNFPGNPQYAFTWKINELSNLLRGYRFDNRLHVQGFLFKEINDMIKNEGKESNMDEVEHETRLWGNGSRNPFEIVVHEVERIVNSIPESNPGKESILGIFHSLKTFSQIGDIQTLVLLITQIEMARQVIQDEPSSQTLIDAFFDVQETIFKTNQKSRIEMALIRWIRKRKENTQ